MHILETAAAAVVLYLAEKEEKIRGDEENIDYYVLPFYPRALQITAEAAAISAFHYAIFLFCMRG